MGSMGAKRRRHDERWDEWFKLLIAFRREHPDRWPSRTTEFPPGRRLGLWCSSQRSRVGRLRAGRRKRLLKIGFSFRSERGRGKKRSWDESYRLLVAFLKRSGGRWPHKQSWERKERRLANWCVTQRRAFRRGHLNNTQARRLEALGVRWGNRRGPYRYQQRSWEEWYELLKKFLARYPDRWPRQTHSRPDEETVLARWWSRQRELLGSGKGREDLEGKRRKDLLEKVWSHWWLRNLPKGWFGGDHGVGCWFSPGVQKSGGDYKNSRWLTQFFRLCSYRAVHGDRWPTEQERGGFYFDLGGWCNWQRSRFRAGTLEPERVRLLEELQFPWSTRKNRSIERIHGRQRGRSLLVRAYEVLGIRGSAVPEPKRSSAEK